ncbi:MAG: hypothetical protein QG665_411, partial [Patescibacteria group bacterium]|nr:hypothetical protein [Patescibacteria group bacterium]
MTRLAIVGDYDSNYIRNDVILTGLKSNQVDFIEYKIPRSGFNRFFIFFKYREEVKKSDYVLVLSSDSSRPLVILCRIFFGKKIIWDAFYSLYDSWVNDRRLAAPRSLKAYYYWFLDW